MNSLTSRVEDKARSWVPKDLTTGQKVILVALMMIFLQLILRAWAIYGGWFYGDDLKFLSQAATERLSLDLLFTRHQQQLMPGGILVAWLVGRGPAFSWPLAATTILAMQALASASCLLMLRNLFGLRPAILIPLALYLFSPLTLGAFMWWAAALNQLPLQIVFFLIIATHVEYMRTRKAMWVIASGALLLIGLLFYIKAVLIVPVLAFVTVAYFAEGRAWLRIRTSLRRFWPAWTSFIVVSAGYLVAYATTGESPIDGNRDSPYLETADRQIREALGPALVGGPWRWLDPGRQDVLANAPDFSISIAWIAIVAVAGLTVQRNVGAWRAWALLVVYLVPTVFLTTNGRAGSFGPDVGLYLRYLSDVSVVACLAIACATMTILGATSSLRPRARAIGVPTRWMTAGVALFAIGAVWSTIAYAQFWQKQSPAETFVSNARAVLDPVDQIDIVDERLPDYFVLGPNAPFDRPSRLLAPFGKKITPVKGGTDLEIFSPSGRLESAVVTPGITSEPVVDKDCGTLVKSKPRSIDLEYPVTDETWWMSIPYLASDTGVLTVEAGDNVKSFLLEEGPHSLFYRTTGTYDSVTLTVATPKLGVCVLEISVGFIGHFD